MTDPQAHDWADEKAREIVVTTVNVVDPAEPTPFSKTLWPTEIDALSSAFARALRAARAEAIEEAARIVERGITRYAYRTIAFDDANPRHLRSAGHCYVDAIRALAPARKETT